MINGRTILPNRFRSLLRMWRQQLNGRRREAVVIQEQGTLPLGSNSFTFVLIYGPYFDQTIPNAAKTCRTGWCNGFEQIGVPYILVSIFDVARCLKEIPNPICWIASSDYIYLDRANLKVLKKYTHIVWVNTWFKHEKEFYEQNNFSNNLLPEKINKIILLSEPAFVYTISPESSFEYYSLWIQHGIQLVSLPLACDASLYFTDTSDSHCAEFEGVEIAFVGGYWPYKARQFDLYLRPHQDRLKVFGYSAWPYSGYGGRLPEHKESSLYLKAKLSPIINEPHVEMMGIDINERVFKVLGSGGMAITDVTPAYRQFFNEKELLVPNSVDEFHDFVWQILNDEGFSRSYRRRGFQAVMNRHTYAHRALTVLNHLGLETPSRPKFER